jgi:hypothetical protein
MGWLRLTLQGSNLTSNLITPAVTINGWRTGVRYGENVIPVHAGRNRVEVACQWVLKFGQASLDVDVPEGGQVSVFYAAPWHQLSRGAIGYQRQSRPGLTGFVVMLAVIIVVVLVLFALPMAWG